MVLFWVCSYKIPTSSMELKIILGIQKFGIFSWGNTSNDGVKEKKKIKKIKPE